MRNSVRLLIGLAMPGLALAAFWLWTTRRARQQESNHSNDTEMARELRDVAEEFKNITRKGFANNVAHKILDFNCSVENNCSELKNNRKQDSLLLKEGSDLNSKLENHDNLSVVSSTQGGFLEICAENDGLLESSNLSNIECSEFSGNTGNSERRDNSTGTYCGEVSHRSNSCIENGCSQDSEKTSGQCEGRTLSPTACNLNFDQSKARNHNDNTAFNQSVHSDASPSDCQSSQLASASQATENISKVITKGPTSRAQSLDESSDVSSIDSKAESPVDQKSSPTASLDSEPAQTEDDTAEEVTWELEFPQALCGRLIGKKGKNVQKISQITGTKLRLIPQKENTESSQRLVALTGTPKRLQRALRALKEKFPSVPFTRLNGSPPVFEGCHGSSTPNMEWVAPRVALPENCQVLVTNIVDANHFYVQLCDYSLQNHLGQLEQQMYQYYGGLGGSMIPQSISTGMLCAAPSPSGWWRRAQVVGLLMNLDEVEVTWLDYGGRMTVPIAMLRQLRSDFVQLSFQAVECYLSNIVPNHGEAQFSMAACALFEQLTQNVILTSRIVGYTRDCPTLELYVTNQWTGQSLFINREFVRRGFARWSET